MKINLGSGTYPLDGWVNYDIITGVVGVTTYDLRKGIPLSDNSVTHIFSEHMLEHIERAECESLLKECYRVANKNCLVRICMPDLQKIAELYIERDENKLMQLGLYESNKGSFCNFFNQAMRAWGHKYLWDKLEFAHALNRAGFHIRTPNGDFPFEGYRKLPTDFTIEAIKL